MCVSRWTKASGFLWATMSLALASAGEVDDARASPRLIRREDDAGSSMPPASDLNAAGVGDTEDDSDQEAPAAPDAEEANAMKLLQDLMDVESDMADEFKVKAADNSDVDSPAVLADKLSSVRSQSAVAADRHDAKTGAKTGTKTATGIQSSTSPSSLNAESTGAASSVATTQVDTASLPTPDELADVTSFNLNPAIQDIWADVAAGNKLGTARAKRKAKAAGLTPETVKHKPNAGNKKVSMLAAAQEFAKNFGKKSSKKSDSERGDADVNSGGKSDSQESKADDETPGDNLKKKHKHHRSTQPSDSMSLFDADQLETLPTPTTVPAAVAINDPDADVIGADGQWPGWSDDDEPTPI